MQTLNLTDSRLYCPSCGKRECNLNDPPNVGVDEWECPHCKTLFDVPAGTALIKSERKGGQCQGGCVYSRSMDQPYPRLCVKCKRPELKAGG